MLENFSQLLGISQLSKRENALSVDGTSNGSSATALHGVGKCADFGKRGKLTPLKTLGYLFLFPFSHFPIE